MKLWATAILVTLAVKNGPLGMWRALGAPAHSEPVNRFVTSPLWLAGTICVCLTLAPSVYRAARGTSVPPKLVPFLACAALGLIVAVDLLARGSALPLLVFAALVAVAVGVALRAGLQPAHHHATHTADTAPVVDLARRRKRRGRRGRIDPR